MISSNWRGSISAAMAGRWRSGRRAPRSSKPSLPRIAGRQRQGRRGRAAVRNQLGRGTVARDLQPRPLRRDLAPGAAAQVARVGPLRGGHAAQLAVDDGDGAPGQHLALDQAIAQALFVGVPLFVPIEEARDRRVSPVDDLHAAARLDEAAGADQHVAALAVFFQAHVAEVGRLAIDGRRVPLAALAGQRLDPVHLLQDRPLVFGLGFGQRVAQLDQRAGVVDLDAPLARRAAVQLAQHDGQQLLFFTDNLGRVVRRAVAAAWGGESGAGAGLAGAAGWRFGSFTRSVSIVAQVPGVIQERRATGARFWGGRRPAADALTPGGRRCIYIYESTDVT